MYNLNKDDKHKQQISSINETHWDKLFALIPLIEESKDFGSYSKSEMLDSGEFIIPEYYPSIVVSDFVRIAYSINMVLSFDWMDWKEGQQMLRDYAFEYDKLDVLTLCKLITMIIRNDRFSEGYMKRCFEDGLVLKLLRSLKNKVLN